MFAANIWVNGAEKRRTHEELRNTQNHEVVTEEDEPGTTESAYSLPVA